MRTGHPCTVSACNRTLGEAGGWICGRCSRLVSPTLWLALEDIRRQMIGAAGEWREFLEWSWQQVAAMIRSEAFYERYWRRSLEYEPWSRDANAELAERDAKRQAERPDR